MTFFNPTIFVQRRCAEDFSNTHPQLTKQYSFSHVALAKVSGLTTETAFHSADEAPSWALIPAKP
jgi:hypothetical protein